MTLQDSLTFTFTEFKAGDLFRQYFQVGRNGGYTLSRLVNAADAERPSGGWIGHQRLNVDTSSGTLAGKPVHAFLTRPEYDDIRDRALTIPSGAWSLIEYARNNYVDAPSGKDKDIPVEPLVKKTRMIGGMKMYQIPLDFLHEGAPITVTRGHEVVDAIVHMDGHSVSRRYGRVNGSAHYIGSDNPDNYINVRFAGRTYRSGGYEVNDGISVKQGHVAWADKDVFDQYVRDHAALVERTAQARNAVKRGELQRKLAAARTQIAEVEAQLAELD